MGEGAAGAGHSSPMAHSAPSKPHISSTVFFFFVSQFYTKFWTSASRPSYPGERERERERLAKLKMHFELGAKKENKMMKRASVAARIGRQT